MGVFFFGLGYSSMATARWIHRLVAPDVPISGTVRSEEKAARLRAQGIRAHVFDGASPSATAREDILTATHVIHSIPPPGPEDPVLAFHRADLDAAANLQWLGYFSTVGVYGDAGGDWIDESAPTRAINARGRNRIDTEQLWLDFARERGLPLLVLRLAGIYGPGRSAFDKLRAGTAQRIIKPNQVFNRIHVEDIGRVTAMAAMRKLGGIYNLADDHPAPPQDMITHAAQLADMTPPPEVPFGEAELTPMGRSFYEENKRCSNAAIKKALGVELLYPSYREGLAAILAAPR